MKRLLFVHGGEKVKQDTEGKYYTDGSYSREVFERYINISSKLTVMFSKDEKIYTKDECRMKFNAINNNVNVVTLNDLYKSIKIYFSKNKRLYNKNIIKENVLSSDFIIARVPSNSSYIAIHYARKYNKPYMLEVVGCPFDTLWNHSWRGRLMAIPEFLKLKITISKSLYAIYVTEQYLQKKYPLFGNSISCSDVSINYNSNVNIKEMKTKISLCTIGAVNLKYKGQQNVIKVLKVLINEGYDVDYYLFGAGSNTRLLKLAQRFNIENNVHFMGCIPHNELLEYLKTIDIYIQPSFSEGLPRALIEAMNAGCFCIGTKVGGIPELLNYQCLYKKRNLASLEKIIKNAINDDAFRKGMISYNIRKCLYYDKNYLEEKRKNFYKKFIIENDLGEFNDED